MFDIGFWEISLIMVIALLVVGPERLPRMARTIGLWVGKGRQILNSVKADIDRELKADELKKLLEEMKRVGKEACATPESARAFLIKVGIITKSGKLSKHYR